MLKITEEVISRVAKEVISKITKEVISRVTERKCCTESKMAFHTKRRKQCAGWSQRQVFLPNLDLVFVFLTFLKNIVFLYLGSNQVSKLLKNELKVIGARATDGR